MEDKKQILALRVIHEEKKRKYFGFTFGMIWVLFKYKFIWGMDVSMTVTRAIDREKYIHEYVQFYAE